MPPSSRYPLAKKSLVVATALLFVVAPVFVAGALLPPIAGPIVSVSHYEQDCITFRNRSVFANVPNACNPIYEADATVHAYAKFTTACSMSSNFFQLTVFEDGDATCSGPGKSIVIALSSVGCNRNQQEGSGFTVSCTGGASTTSAAYIFAQHGDNSCANFRASSVIPNQVGCVPIYDADFSASGYIQNDGLCGTQDHLHLVKFFPNSSCSGAPEQLLQLWVNDVDSCNPDRDDASRGTAIKCYGVSGQTGNQNQILVLHGDGECGNNITSTSSFANVVGCNPLYESYLGDVHGYIKLSDVAGSSDLFVSAEMFNNSACTGSGSDILVATGPERCNYESEWQNSVRVVKSLQVRIFSNVLSGSGDQNYVYVQHGDERCENVHATTIFGNTAGTCSAMIEGGYLPSGFASATSACAQNAFDFQTISIFNDSDDACSSSMPNTFTVATGSMINVCNVAPGGDGSRVECFGSTSHTSTDYVFLEHFEDSCVTHRYTEIATNVAGQCVPMVLLNGSVDLWVTFPRACHPNHQFLEANLYHTSDCSDAPTYTVMVLAGSNDRCNVGDSGHGVRIRCTNSASGTFNALPWVFVEHFGDTTCRSGSVSSTNIFNNTNACTALYSADLDDPSLYVKLANPCGVTSTFAEVDVYTNSTCDSGALLGHFIVQTKLNVQNGGGCTVQADGGGIALQCFGRPDASSGPNAFIVYTSSSSPSPSSCSSFEHSATIQNLGSSVCSKVYDEQGQVSGSARVSSGVCSVFDQVVTVDHFDSLDCSGLSNRSVLATQGKCNVGGPLQTASSVRCFGSTAASSTAPFIRTEMSSYECGSNFTQTSIVANAPGACQPVHIGNSQLVESWVLLDAICASNDDFVSLMAFNTSTCSGTGKRIVVRAGEANCNFGGNGTFALRATCYAPGVAKHDQSYAFVTKSQGCESKMTTFAVDNVANGCSLLVGTDSGSNAGPAQYVKFLHVCSSNDKFHAVATYSDAACTLNERHLLVRVGASECNLNDDDNVGSTVECFAPSGTLAQEDDAIYSEIYDPTCTVKTLTTVTPNIADACVPVTLSDGSVTAYLKMTSPCSMSNTYLFNSSVYSDSQCLTQIAQSSVVAPDGETCNLRIGGSGASAHISCYGGFTAPPGYVPGTPISNPAFIPPPVATPTGSSSTTLPSALFLFFFSLLVFYIAI